MADQTAVTPAPLDISDREPAAIMAMLKGGGGSAAPEAVEPGAVVDAPAIGDVTPAAEEATPEAKTEPESDPETTQERDEQGKFKPKDEVLPNVQKRIDKEIGKTVAARREAERIRDELAAALAKVQGTDPATKTPAPAADSAKPVAANFETYEQYVEALTDWKADQRDAQRAQADAAAQAKDAQTKTQEAFQAQLTAARGKHADFDKAFEVVADKTLPAPVLEAVMTSPVAGELAYYFGKHPAEADRIIALSPIAAIREIGKIEATLAEAPKPAASAAPAKPLPKPPAQVSGAPKGAGPDLNDPNLPMDAFVELARKSLKRPTF